MNNYVTTNNATPRKRDSTLDVAKGIGIILVVFAHIIFIEPWETIIYSFHMPLFIIISGMLFDREKYSDFKHFLVRRCKTLLIPYLAFCTLTLVLFGLFWLLQHLSPPEMMRLLANSAFQFIYAPYSLMIELNVPMWFVPCLFLIELMYYFIAKIKNKYIFFTIIVLLVGFGWFSESKYSPLDFSVLPWNFSSACFSIGFYCLGHQMRGYYKKTIHYLSASKHKVLIALCAMVISFAVMVPLALLNEKISIGSRLLNNGLLLYLTGILGTVGIIALSFALQSVRFLQFVGKNSFYIMAIHVPLKNAFVLELVVRLMPTYNEATAPYHWIPGLTAFLIDLSICFIFILLYSRVRSRFFTGGKNGRIIGNYE